MTSQSRETDLKKSLTSYRQPAITWPMPRKIKRRLEEMERQAVEAKVITDLDDLPLEAQ